MRPMPTPRATPASLRRMQEAKQRLRFRPVQPRDPGSASRRATSLGTEEAVHPLSGLRLWTLGAAALRSSAAGSRRPGQPPAARGLAALATVCLQAQAQALRASEAGKGTTALAGSQTSRCTQKRPEPKPTELHPSLRKLREEEGRDGEEEGNARQRTGRAAKEGRGGRD